MIKLKTAGEIEIIREGGSRLRHVVAQLRAEIKVGLTTNEVDKKAEYLIKKFSGEPSFKKVAGYNWSTCLAINNQIVHTPPSNRKLKNGDILTLDIGLFYRGFHTDYAYTFVVGQQKDSRIKHFLEVGQIALKKAISKVKIGGKLGAISQVIEKEICGNGYFVIKELTGHGIGRSLHEDPYIPGYLNKPIAYTPVIRPGLVVAIEVIYSMGAGQMVYEKGDRWSIVTADGSLAACFEHTVVAGKKGGLVLT